MLKPISSLAALVAALAVAFAGARAGHDQDRRDQQLQGAARLPRALQEGQGARGRGDQRRRRRARQEARGDHARRQRATRATRCASPRSWSRARGVALIAGTFLSNIGLAVTDFAKQKKVFFLAAEPLTDKITWQNGNHYTFRLRPEHLHAGGDAGARGGQAEEEALGRRLSELRIRPVGGGDLQGDAEEAAQPDVEFVAEQATPLGRIDAGAWCRRSPTPSPTRSSTCCSAPTCRSSCARATRAACSRTARSSAC